MFQIFDKIRNDLTISIINSHCCVSTEFDRISYPKWRLIYQRYWTEADKTSHLGGASLYILKDEVPPPLPDIDLWFININHPKQAIQILVDISI